MATSSNSVTMPSATALPSAVTPDGRVMTLPPEVVDTILEQVKEEDKGDLSRVMSTSKTMFEHTFKLLRKTATLKMLRKLLDPRKERLRRYAQAIHEIDFTIGPRELLPPLHGFEFLHLKRISIIHDSMQPVYVPDTPAGCHVHLAHFMVPSLTEVRLSGAANPLGNYMMANLSAGNFLPHLARNCPQLETLIIDAKIYGATCNDLDNVLRSCTKLKNLGFGRVAIDLKYNDAFSHMIAHPRLSAPHLWVGPYLNQINQAVNQSSKPALANLTDLDMMIHAGEVTWLLPHLSRLKRLRLELNDDSGVSVFPYLSRMTTLVHLDITYIDGFLLTGAELEDLYPLKNLKYFIYFGHEQDNPPPHTNIAGFIQPSTKPCELHSLEVLSIGMDDGWHIRQQLLTIAQTARNLKYLHVDGTFDFRLMEFSTNPLFPELRDLVPNLVYDAPMPGTTVTERASMLVSLLSKHAPKLRGLWVLGGGFGEEVEAAWKALHENSIPNMQRYATYPQAPLGPHRLA